MAALFQRTICTEITYSLYNIIDVLLRKIIKKTPPIGK
jgi:hypothetical protein